MSAPHPCPVCGRHSFPRRNSHDICPVCGWQDDRVQEDDPDYPGGANHLSLNGARAAYIHGKEDAK